MKRGDPVRNSKNTLSMYVDTLAAAHYALGDADMALHYSEIAVEICPVDSPHLEDIYEAYVKHRDAAARGDKPI